VTPQVRDRLALDVLGEREILRIGERQIVILDQLTRVLRAAQVQAVPVDDGRPRQDQTQGFDVMQCELVEALERRP